jgi:23S rRNA (guanosine2251-2'-O)-methyltransferase
VVPKRDSVGLTPVVIRASMGGAFYVPLVVERLFLALKLLSDEGVRIIGVDPRSSVDYHEVRLTGSVAFVLGGESKGISKELLSKCDNVVRIPMKGRISSLNVGVAAAIVLYERLRQLKQLEETR